MSDRPTRLASRRISPTPSDDIVILKKPPFRLSWYHRDELQIVGVFVALVLFFSRSTILSSVTLALVVSSVAFLYVFRFIRVIILENTHIPIATTWLRHVETKLLFTSPERSRIVMTALSCVILGILCVHRIALALSLSEFETPADIYWILFLAWYWVVWTFVLGYLLYRSIRNRGVVEPKSPFFEGLIASMFFYHGLPTKQRIITFTSGFILGGIPTYVATNLHPHDATAYTMAAVLVLPVIILTLGGAWYATRWHIK